MKMDANFNGMIQQLKPLKNLYVSEFVQKVSINMTETAAVAPHENIAQQSSAQSGPGPSFGSSSVWLQYNLNRPFVFTITNPSSVDAIGKFMG